MSESEHLAIEQGGWVRWLQDGWGIPNVRIRFVPDAGGRLVAREVRIADEDGLRSGVLRDVPLARLERWVNRPDVAAFVRDAIAGTARASAEAPRAGIGPRVAVPERHGRAPYPASFYRRVGEVVAAGHSARAIAAASGVPQTTVTRWIKGARERGFLAPSRHAERKDP